MRYSKKNGKSGISALGFLVTLALVLQLMLTGCGGEREADNHAAAATAAVTETQVSVPAETASQEAATGEETTEAPTTGETAPELTATGEENADETATGEENADETATGEENADETATGEENADKETTDEAASADEEKVDCMSSLKESLKELSDSLAAALPATANQTYNWAEAKTAVDELLKQFNSPAQYPYLQSLSNQDADAEESCLNFLKAVVHYTTLTDPNAYGPLDAEQLAQLEVPDGTDFAQLTDAHTSLIAELQTGASDGFYSVLMDLQTVMAPDIADDELAGAAQALSQKAQQFVNDTDAIYEQQTYIQQFQEVVEVCLAIQAEPNYITLTSYSAEAEGDLQETAKNQVEAYKALAAQTLHYFEQESLEKAADSTLLTDLQDMQKEIQRIPADPAIYLSMILSEHQDKKITENEQAIGALRQDLNASKEERDAAFQPVEEKQSLHSLLIYICLGVAGLTLIMAIVATVCALTKSRNKGEPMATQKETAALNQKCDTLRDQNRLMEEGRRNLIQKVNNLESSVKAVSRTSSSDLELRISKLEKRIQDLEKQKAASASVYVSAAPVIQRSSLGYFELDYQPLSDQFSRLNRNPNGKVEIFDDGTAQLAESEFQKFNSMQNWISKGLLYLYDAELDGVRYSQEQLKGLHGNYNLTELIQPANVTAENADCYRLVSRGCVKMTKFGQ